MDYENRAVLVRSCIYVLIIRTLLSYSLHSTSSRKTKTQVKKQMNK